MVNESSRALINRAVRTIKTELDFLAESSVISPQQCSSILSQLPADDSSRDYPLSTTTAVEENRDTPITVPSTDIEKTIHRPISTAPTPPPPAYASGPPVLSSAIALYAYSPTDVGDLLLEHNDRIQVTEHMNNDWWRGRNERTGLEGIFPRSYVETIDEKGRPALSGQGSTYGPEAIDAQCASGSAGQLENKKPTKFEENGRKFGKRMGNAAIFGAGAQIGSSIVRGVF